jgi:hypothetical protein
VPVAIDALILDKHKTEIEDTFTLAWSLSYQAYLETRIVSNLLNPTYKQHIIEVRILW